MTQTTGATQKFVDIDEIKNEVIYMKNGGLRKVLLINGINFDLRSEEEQQMILGSFQSFLNRLDFPIEFFIHSRKINIKSYLDKMKQREEDEKNELLKIQIGEYINFIRSFVEENPIITKSFFVVVPYNPIATVEEAKKGLSKIMTSLTGGNKKEDEKNESMSKKLQQLNYRVEEVVAGLEQIGLRTNKMSDEELTELFYNLYNPQLIERAETTPKK